MLTQMVRSIKWWQHTLQKKKKKQNIKQTSTHYTPILNKTKCTSIYQQKKDSAFQYHISQAIMLWKQSSPQILRRLKIPQDPNKKRSAGFVLIWTIQFSNTVIIHWITLVIKHHHLFVYTNNNHNWIISFNAIQNTNKLEKKKMHNVQTSSIRKIVAARAIWPANWEK